jgi:Flp pilus assembly protein TadD
MTQESGLATTLEEALAASAAGRIDDALSLLRRACAVAPGDATPQFLLGAELAQAGRYEDAENHYAAAVSLAPSLAIARFELGVLQFTSGRPAVALVTWQPLLELPAGDPLRLFASGYVALAQDRFQDAQRLFVEGMAANTANPPLNANIRIVLERLRELQPQPAAQDTTQAHVLLAGYRNQGGGT